MSIEKIKKGDPLSESKDLLQENINQLKTLFPEIVTEGKIDFKALQAILGEEIEEGEEFYRFTWAGKAQARREAHKPSTGTLRPCPEESVDWDKTKNLYIEGDNLEVLKLLQKSYASKVKMIYIDPPYNTGQDFIYKDNYKDNLKNYQELTGQIDNDGNKISTNTDSDGRYHSNWLNMMYPRLKLARNLLKEDGVIFMSIDENEVHNLISLGNNIYGSNNFRGIISRSTGTRMGSGNKKISSELDYIIVYSKSEKFNFLGLPMNKEDLKIYDKKDEKGIYLTRSLRRTGGENRREDRPSMFYPVYAPDGTEVYPIAPEGWESRWVCGKDTYVNLDKEGIIEWKKVIKKGVEKWQVYQKHYLGESVKFASNSWNELDGNKKATREVNALFDNIKLFDHPKPLALMKKIIIMSSSVENDIIIDFFSGSCTTAHALMKINIEDEKNRKFLMIQLPEPTDPKSVAYKTGYKTIAEIGKERIRRAAKKIVKENPLLAPNTDLGFKVFKLDSSNIQAWSGNPDNLEKELFDAVDNIKTDRSEEDVLYEILLKYGLDLTLPISEKMIAGKKVFNVGMGAIFICLATEITSEVSEGIGQWKAELDPAMCRVIFKDSGFKSDAAKTNAQQNLKRFGITEVKSI